MQREVARLALIGGVDVDDVDVGREVQLLAAELAHADDGQGGVARAAVVVGVAGRAVARAQLAIVERDREIERRVGEARELAADLGLEPELELAGAESHELVGAIAAEGGAQVVGRADARGGTGELGAHGRGGLLAAQVRIAGDPGQPGGIAGEQRGEVGSVLT